MTKLAKPIILIVAILCCVIAVNAQQVTGRVASAEDGTPLIGVNITVKGNLTGTISDTDGTFQIAADPGNTLVFTYIGYKAIEITLGNEKDLTVSMEESAQGLDEVIVTALGIKKESKKLGYSATAVNPDQLLEN